MAKTDDEPMFGGADEAADMEPEEDTDSEEMDLAAAEELGAAIKDGDPQRILDAWNAMP